MTVSVKTPKFNRLWDNLQSSVASAIHPANDSECFEQVYKLLKRTIVLSTLLRGSAINLETFSLLEMLDPTIGLVSTATFFELGVLSFPRGSKRVVQ